MRCTKIKIEYLTTKDKIGEKTVALPKKVSDAIFTYGVQSITSNIEDKHFLVIKLGDTELLRKDITVEIKRVITFCYKYEIV